jgi:hypothetical protein
MVGLKADVQLSGDEDKNVKEILSKYGWQPTEWGGAITGGYKGSITVGGTEIKAHLFYGMDANLTLESNDPKAKRLLAKTELAPYLERTKIKKIASAELSNERIEQMLQKLREHGWTDGPEYGSAFTPARRVHELSTFNIQGQEFRAQGLGNPSRTDLTLTLYSTASKASAKKSLKNSDLAEILSMSK